MEIHNEIGVQIDDNPNNPLPQHETSQTHPSSQPQPMQSLPPPQLSQSQPMQAPQLPPPPPPPEPIHALSPQIGTAPPLLQPMQASSPPPQPMQALPLLSLEHLMQARQLMQALEQQMQAPLPPLAPLMHALQYQMQALQQQIQVLLPLLPQLLHAPQPPSPPQPMHTLPQQTQGPPPQQSPSPPEPMQTQPQQIQALPPPPPPLPELMQTQPQQIQEQQSPPPPLSQQMQAPPPLSTPGETRLRRSATAVGVQNALSKTAMLTNFLPTGTLLTYESVLPSIAGDGDCTPTRTIMINLLLSVCVLSCFIFHFTDSFIGPDESTVHYGFVTPKGLVVFRPDTGVEVLKDRRYKAGFLDFIHAILTVIVFLSIAFSDHRVSNCLFQGHLKRSMEEVMESLPLFVGIICSALFLVFPKTRRGFGS